MNDWSKHTEGDDTGDEDYLPHVARPRLDQVELPDGKWDSFKILVWLGVLGAGILVWVGLGILWAHRP